MEESDFLLEIGTEELPPHALVPLSEALCGALEKAFRDAGLTCASLQPFATPRRLAVLTRDLALGQPEKAVERKGPALSAAFDENGEPTKAAQGFASSCGVSVAQLERLQTDKGQWLVHRATDPGQWTIDLLPDIVRRAVTSLPIPKRMRWGEGNAIFVRPVHWLVALLGAEVVDIELFETRTDHSTMGHRFHCPEPLTLQQAGDYENTLLRSGWVIPDFDQRRASIREQIARQADALGGTVASDPGLLDEITALVEWPVALSGRFEKRFLALPDEVLIATLKDHQRYFPVYHADGGLLPAFVTVANLRSRSPALVERGNERVVRPRLEDALFFWEQDQKRPLHDLAGDLGRVLFQKGLGSLADKAERVESLADAIARATATSLALLPRTARLAKADLLTDMVGEFPELQGTMGRYYALAAGESQELATALEEQYHPRFAQDDLPTTPLGRILSIADRLDTLSGIYALGKKPTGEKDPFGLRRAALGVLRISIEGGVDLDLEPLVETGLKLQPVPSDTEQHRELLDFFAHRLKAYYAAHSVPVEIHNSIASIQTTRPLDFQKRLDAVREFLALPESHQLAAAHKRIRNILRQSEQQPADSISSALLQNDSEQDLYRQLIEITEKNENLIQSRDYVSALKFLARLGRPVDWFFDSVRVMDENMDLRRNRLALLSQLDRLCRSVADLSCLPG